MSRTEIDNFIWSVEKVLWDSYGLDASERLMYPLKWYIFTGRASADFLNRLSQEKPKVIGMLLKSGGSDYEVMNRIKKHIGYEEIR